MEKSDTIKIYIQRDGVHLISREKDGKIRRPKNIEKTFAKYSKILFAQREYEDYNDLIDDIGGCPRKFIRDFRYTDKYGRNMFLAMDEIPLTEKGFFDSKPQFTVLLACVEDGKLYLLYTNDVSDEVFVREDADCISEGILYESLEYEEMRDFVFGENCRVVDGLWFEVDDV